MKYLKDDIYIYIYIYIWTEKKTENYWWSEINVMV